MDRLRTRQHIRDQAGIAIVGELGAMELWWFTCELPTSRHVGGVEAHRREPALYQDDSSKHDERSLLDGRPCWHDGTSLWASEYWLPLLEKVGEGAVFDEMERRYKEFMSDE